MYLGTFPCVSGEFDIVVASGEVAVEIRQGDASRTLVFDSGDLFVAIEANVTELMYGTRDGETSAELAEALANNVRAHYVGDATLTPALYMERLWVK